MDAPTLAAKLGTTTHLSPLLRKARRLGLGPRELQILAVQRGCRHYSNGSEPEQPLASEAEFSHEELAIALLSTALPYDPHSIRCGAAMLGAEGNNPRRLAHLAVLERCVVPGPSCGEGGLSLRARESVLERAARGASARSTGQVRSAAAPDALRRHEWLHPAWTGFGCGMAATRAEKPLVLP